MNIPILSVRDDEGNIIPIPAIKGKDGYTPQKGIDYFDGKKGDKGDPYTLTEADKEEIKNAVIDELPKDEVVERPTETIELSYSNGDIDFITDAPSKSVKAVSYGDSVIPLSSEIQKIEILFNDNNYPDWINLHDMINYDPQNPYILFANKAFFSETECMPIYFRIYFIGEFNVIAGLIDSYKVNKVKITYYTD